MGGFPKPWRAVRMGRNLPDQAPLEMEGFFKLVLLFYLSLFSDSVIPIHSTKPQRYKRGHNAKRVSPPALSSRHAELPPSLRRFLANLCRAILCTCWKYAQEFVTR